MTLLAEIQAVWEKTYAAAGINLEECLIGPGRCAALTNRAGPVARDLSPDGRTFLHRAGDALYLAIFYANPVIEELERNDPRECINERNIAPFITFVEEITHGLQAALLFQEGERAFESETFARNLECQAKVDTYLILTRFARMLCGTPLPRRVQRWLHDQLFVFDPSQFPNPLLRKRYAFSREVALGFLQVLKRTPRSQRHSLLREFRAMRWSEKQSFLSG